MQESSVQNQITRALGSRPDTRIFRNQVGSGWVGELVSNHGGVVTLRHARHVVMGLAPGSADLIGWHTTEITPAMVGRRFAAFLSVEVKSSSGRARPEQINWAKVVRDFGGISMIARTPAEAVGGLCLLPAA